MWFLGPDEEGTFELMGYGYENAGQLHLGSLGSQYSGVPKGTLQLARLLHNQCAWEAGHQLPPHPPTISVLNPRVELSAFYVDSIL